MRGEFRLPEGVCSLVQRRSMRFCFLVGVAKPRAKGEGKATIYTCTSTL